MIAKMALYTGVSAALGVSLYFIYKHVGSEPGVYPYSREEVQRILFDARTVVPTPEGGGQTVLWGAGRSMRGVTLHMRYPKWSSVFKCEAVITAVSPTTSRVDTDCGRPPNAESARSRIDTQSRVPMFEEHIEATLRNRRFNMATVERQRAAYVLANVGDLQREARKSFDEAAEASVRFGR